METKTNRIIKSGAEYNYLFPAANLNDETVKKGATVSDTVKFIPKVVRETLPQTKKISKVLKGSSIYETCKNIWHFVYNHINYQKDDDGLEQIRSPGRSWHDRVRGVDCDCYTVFISSILTNMKIPHLLRIAKYKKDYFQHIYPVVPTGKENLPAGASAQAGITIDCVVDRFNYEEPYKEKKDTTMDLQYLSGTDNSEDTFGEDDMGRLFKRKTKSGSGEKKGFLKNVIKKTANIVKKPLHIANRINPATVLLRNGVLASMKLNIFKIAQRLKFAYLSDEEAKKRGVDIGKFQKLKTVMGKLENIFYGAGGKPENLKKAILTGRGNKNREVSGLGYYNVSESDISEMNESTPLPQLLGDEIFTSEMEGLGELGEPVTAASITAATGALAAIAGLLKSIGSIFPKKEKGSEDFENTETEGGEQNLPAEIEKNQEEISKMEMDTSSEKSSGNDSASDDSTQEGFWDKNRKWLKPTLWGAGGLGLLYAGYRFLGGKKEQPKVLSGTKRIKHHKHKKEVALM